MALSCLRSRLTMNCGVLEGHIRSTRRKEKSRAKAKKEIMQEEAELVFRTLSLFCLWPYLCLWTFGSHLLRFCKIDFVESGSIWARVSILLQIDKAYYLQNDKSDLLLKFSVSAALPKNWKLHARWNSIIAEYAYSAIESTTYVICSTFNRWPCAWAAYADRTMDKIKLWLLQSMIVWKCIHR